MPGSIYLKTLHDLRGAVVAWSVGIAALGAVNVLVFPTVQQMPGLISFLDNLPPALKAMIGDVHAMVQLGGFLKIKLFDPLPLLLAVFGVSHGAQLIAGECEHKSIDLLMARPVRRWRVVVEKFAALASGMVVVALTLAVSLVISAGVIGAEVSAGYLVVATVNGLPLSLLFCALALVGSCALRHARQAALMAGSIVVASYVLETLRILSPALAGWRPVSLFAYHKAGFSLAGEVSVAPVLLLLGITVALVVGAMVAWERRDLV